MAKFDFWGWRSKKKENIEPETENTDLQMENADSETESVNPETENAGSETEKANSETETTNSGTENTASETEITEQGIVNAALESEAAESQIETTVPEMEVTKSEMENTSPGMDEIKPGLETADSETVDAKPGIEVANAELEITNSGTETLDLETEDAESEIGTTDSETENVKSEAGEIQEPAEEAQEESESESESEFESEQESEADLEQESEPESEAEPVQKQGFFSRLKAGLTKTRDNIVHGMDRVFLGYSSIDDDFYEELEEIMIMGDMGIHATDEILTKLKQQVEEQHIHEPQACRELLIQNISEQMQVDEHAYDFEKQPSIVMVIGVNGVGKTTSVGKLAGIYKKQGKKVLIAAADTFRAAAGEQLQEWANRAGVDIISAPEGSDPASVVYDAACAARARRADILLCDTAGRLHNKKNLMEELRKMDKIISREYPEAMRENLVVLDGATGQNALSQAREFGNVTDLTGIILTKMDGTSKGGIAIAVQSELHIPVKFIGVGEKMEDLQKFNPDEFVTALFEREKDEADPQEI